MASRTISRTVLELIKDRDKLSVPQLQLLKDELFAYLKDLRPNKRESLGDTPATFAESLSATIRMYKFQMAPHIKYVGERIAAFANGEVKDKIGLLISTPPRHSKSETCSFWTPLWLLHRNPRTRILLASYEATFAETWGRRVRDYILDNSDALDLHVNPDHAAASAWSLKEGGTMHTAGVGGPMTGRGGDVILIDDPIKNQEEAASPVYRDKAWAWFNSVALTRLEPGGFIICIGCLTADALVALSDGTKRPIKDIRSGDTVLTYKDGRITTSTVTNWANQGPDKVFAIRMKSGTVIRANARHPFLVATKEGTQWRRTDTLKKGESILRVTEESGVELPALIKTVRSPLSVRDSVCPTMERTAGQVDTDHHPAITTTDALPILSTAMESHLGVTRQLSKPKEEFVPSADAHQNGGSQDSISSSLITAIIAGESEDFYATPATSSLDMPYQQKPLKLPQTTYGIIPDTIIEITDGGFEDVYDIEVEQTHNFIANGLITHNTRWHEDDLIGRLELASANGEGLQWEVIKFPAIAELGDPMGRPVGKALWPERYPEDKLKEIRKSLGPYQFSALYQQNPTPEEGNSVLRRWWRFYTEPAQDIMEKADKAIQTWDLAIKETAYGSFTVGFVLAQVGSLVYVIDRFRKRINTPEMLAKVEEWHKKYPKALAKIIEDKAAGPAVISTLYKKIPGLVPWPPRGSKMQRLNAVISLIEAGQVLLPDTQWAKELIEEAAAFPNAAHDDQVDALTQGLTYLYPQIWQRLEADNATLSTQEKAKKNIQEQELGNQFWKWVHKSTKETEKRVNSGGQSPRRTLPY